MKKIYALSILLAGMLPAFAQTDTTQALGEVVVTGQYAPQPLRSSVYKVRTINAEYIRMRGATDIVGVLNSELGIRFATDNTLGEFFFFKQKTAYEI